MSRSGLLVNIRACTLPKQAMPPVGIEPTTFGLKDAHMQGK
jgi:hypothetical protein